jgi:hypothetical protein
MYYLLAEHFTQEELCRFILKTDHSINMNVLRQYISDSMFRTNVNSIIVTDVSGMAWIFFRSCRWIIQMLFRTCRVRVGGRDIGILLDRRTNSN